MVGQQPTAAGHRLRDAVRVGTVEVDPDAERIRQVRWLVDPLGLGNQQETILQRPGDPRNFPFMPLKPGQPPLMRRADAGDQRWIHAHGLPHTADSSGFAGYTRDDLSAIVGAGNQACTSRPLHEQNH